MAAMHHPQFRIPPTLLWCSATRAMGKHQGWSILQRRRRSTMAWLAGLTYKAVSSERVLVVDDDAARESVGEALVRGQAGACCANEVIRACAPCRTSGSKARA